MHIVLQSVVDVLYSSSYVLM